MTPPRPSGPVKRVLVVDDEPDLVDIMATALSSQGFAVTSAPDGLQAMAQIRRDCPDAMLLDLNMPRMDGWAVLEQLRAQPPARPLRIVVLTGSERSASGREQVLAAGAAAFLVKPCDPDQVVRVVTRVLGRPWPAS